MILRKIEEIIQYYSRNMGEIYKFSQKISKLYCFYNIFLDKIREGELRPDTTLYFNSLYKINLAIRVG